MNADLIITTYNRPDALEAVLVSIIYQHTLPSQVIVADDGSRSDTKELIDRYQKIFPIPLVHSWQDDAGFRAAESRNRALSLVSSEYVIMIDGDLILDRFFIYDHLSYAKRGCFLQGGRILMTEERTKAILANPSAKNTFHIFSSGLEHRMEKRLTAFRSIFLGNIFFRELNNKSKIRSCNMSFFFSDIVAVNGFNNKFVGWGREDSEFVERLINNGITGRVLKFVALGYHLYHKEESRQSVPENDVILNNAIDEKLIWCEDGLSKFN